MEGWGRVVMERRQEWDEGETKQENKRSKG